LDNKELVETLEDFGFNDAIKHTTKILEQIDLVDTNGIIKRYFPGNKLENDQISFYFCLAAIIYEESHVDNEYSQVLCFFDEHFIENWYFGNDLNFLTHNDLENIFFYLMFLSEKFSGFIMGDYGDHLNHRACLVLGKLGGELYKKSLEYNNKSPIKFFKKKRDFFDFTLDNYIDEKKFNFLIFLFSLIVNSKINIERITPIDFFNDIKISVSVAFSDKDLLDFIDIIDNIKTSSNGHELYVNSYYNEHFSEYVSDIELDQKIKDYILEVLKLCLELKFN
jgi:hypothetical protein